MLGNFKNILELKIKNCAFCAFLLLKDSYEHDKAPHDLYSDYPNRIVR
ncbi:hypothetical protein [Campylobacter sp.]|nr:hypothetical protein [Campylobacter sp.]MDY4803024.1 hypothetical protein [Campylobacter sp.]